MSDWHDYKENLAFPPQGDWSDTQPKSCTDRTPQVLELIDRVAKLEKENKKLNKWLDLKSEYIAKLEKENKELKEWLRDFWYFDE